MDLTRREIEIIRAWGDAWWDEHNGFNEEELDLWDKLHNALIQQ